MLPRLSIFALFPPAPSGIADYCLDLSPYWNQHFRALYIIADDAPEPIGLPLGAEVIRHQEFMCRPEYRDSTPRLYHVGNNQLHAFVRRESERKPGITVLHDFVLHHSLAGENRDARDPGSFAARMLAEHGDKSESLLRLKKGGWYFGDDPYRFPLNEYQLEHSLGVVVHSHEAAERIRFAYPSLAVKRIPHYAVSPPLGAADQLRTEARRRLRIDPEEFIFAAFGFVTRPKQIELALAALSKIADHLPPFRFLLVGEFHHAAKVRAAVARYGLVGRVTSSGFVSPDTFNDHILACDVAINLRYPSGLETSGTLIRCMAFGRPVVVFNYDSFTDYPDDAVVKLPLDTLNTEQLEQALLRLARDRSHRENIGRAAASYTAKHHAVEDCAAEYARFIEETHAGGRG
jgi:glycosyltransferase involved in cell wall biosynthesis